MALTRATDKIIANADGNLNLSGIVTASRFSGPLVPSGDLNVGNNIKLGAASGIVTATSFSGDGSNLTSLPAGLGTALSSTQTSPLNKLYYTNEILSIGATVTVDHPATGTGAYTQYADIRLEEGADLIIEDGDDVIPDILGLGTDGGGLGAGGSGRIRVDSITNKNANGAPTATNGLTVTGVVTATTFVGNLTGNPTGSGANLTGVLKNIVEDTSPQLGGNLDCNNKNISLNDSTSGTNNRIKIGTNDDLHLWHNSSTGNSNISNYNGDLYIQGNNGSGTGVNQIAIKSNAAVELNYQGTKQCETSANGLAFPNGKGIDFSAHGNTAGMTGELLNDYEEGTWTPEIKGTTGAGTASYNNQVGKYLKIGNWVYLTWVLGWSSGSAGGEMRTTGFPFTPATDCTGIGSVMFNNVSIHSSVSNIATYIGPTNAYCYFYTSRSSAGWITVNYSSSGNLIANVSFRTA